jgi:CHAT domain-containing protein
LYELDLARVYFNQALAQAISIKDVSAQTLALTGLACLHHRQGESQQALNRIAQAQQLNRQPEDAEAEAALLHLRGQVNQEAGQLEKANHAYTEALAIYRKISNVEGQVKVLCLMANLSLLASHNQAALEQATQAVELVAKPAQRAANIGATMRGRELRWRAWFSRARAERAAGLKELAAKSYLRALVQVGETWWLVKISTETSAIAFREESQALYREYIDLLIEQGNVNEAYYWADIAKARTLRSATEARRSLEPSGDEGRAKTLRELARPIARLRTQLISADLSNEQRATLQKELRDAEYALEEKRVQAEMGNSRERLIWSEPATVKALQAKLTQDKSALLEFLLGEARSFCWLITPGGISVEVLPGRKEIEKAVRPYLEALTTPPNHLYLEKELAKLRAQAAGLCSVLFGRLAGQLAPGQKLIVVPDGLLHYLPFEALIHDERYLLEDHEISYDPAASMLSLWPASSDPPAHGKQLELLAFGDPQFETEAKVANARKPDKRVSPQTQAMRSVLGSSLAPLPRTRDEVQYIADLFPADRCRTYLGKDATEDALKREPLHNYKRLHLATHGLSNETAPSRSAMVLALDDDPEEDGFLEVGEIAELHLDCDLVVLSACQTGRGQLLSGEGIVGLCRAFMRAGARSVVVSLWNVSDISTSRLMKSFYQGLTGNLSNAAALRQAKLQMLKRDGVTRHPFYWSPFILTGKP